MSAGSVRKHDETIDIRDPLPVWAGGIGGRRGPPPGAGGCPGRKRTGAVQRRGSGSSPAQFESALRGAGAAPAGGVSRPEL